MSLTLTPRAGELLRFIQAYTAAHGGVAPSRREMADAVGEKSVSGAQRLFDQLVDRGLVNRLPGRVRAIEIVQGHAVTLPPDLYLEAHAAAGRAGIPVSKLVAAATRAWLDTD